MQYVTDLSDSETCLLFAVPFLTKTSDITENGKLTTNKQHHYISKQTNKHVMDRQTIRHVQNIILCLTVWPDGSIMRAVGLYVVIKDTGFGYTRHKVKNTVT